MTPHESLHIAWNARNLTELAGRCSMSGVRIVGRDMSEHHLYEKTAVIPTTPQPCTQEFLHSLLATPDTPDQHVLELLNLTPKIVKQLETDSRQLSHTVNAPGAITTTTNDKTSLRPGLHIDTGPGHRILGANLGPGDRYFIIATTYIAADSNVELTTSTIRKHVVNNPGALACLWVKLKKGQAYIAPVERLAHDGGTYGAAEWSILQPWRDRWPENGWPRGHFVQNTD